MNAVKERVASSPSIQLTAAWLAEKDACREAGSETCLETCRHGREALQVEGSWAHA